MPMANTLNVWQQTFIRDASRLYEQAILFKLEQGMNTIEIVRRTGYFKLGQIYVEYLETYIPYDTYLDQHQTAPYVNDTLYSFEAETIYYKNDVSIRYSTDRNPTNTPFGLIEARLNVVDGGTFRKPGQAIFY